MILNSEKLIDVNLKVDEKALRRQVEIYRKVINKHASLGCVNRHHNLHTFCSNVGGHIFSSLSRRE